MNLHTRYLGLELASPLIPGASPMSDDPDMARRLEDAGASALVMSSLFEEELAAPHTPNGKEDPVSRKLPGLAQRDHNDLRVAPEDYFDRVYRLKHAVEIPVIASLNGSTLGGWLKCAQQIEEAGADALELNIYSLSIEPSRTGEEVERELIEIIRTLRSELAIPVSVKLSPYYSALTNLAAHLHQAGAEAIVLFNRFYQPMIDWPGMTLRRGLPPSDPNELNMRLRWAAILSSRVTKLSIAVTGGINHGSDAAKAIACGASAVQIVSPLIQHGPEHLRTLNRQLENALEQANCSSVAGLRGRLSLSNVQRQEPYLRANYYRLLRDEARDVRQTMGHA
jgi:dihydroorotate dehydrogenase (fumarate)